MKINVSTQMFSKNLIDEKHSNNKIAMDLLGIRILAPNNTSKSKRPHNEHINNIFTLILCPNISAPTVLQICWTQYMDVREAHITRHTVSNVQFRLFQKYINNCNYIYSTALPYPYWHRKMVNITFILRGKFTNFELKKKKWAHLKIKERVFVRQTARWYGTFL